VTIYTIAKVHGIHKTLHRGDSVIVIVCQVDVATVKFSPVQDIGFPLIMT